ncbi:transglutaminase 2 S homeolog [Xenopus laevis]|uniref:Protein-glutamine gamma-glutamyltransferase 2 n=1 Tax=Xenopus laevis TaxID=8355 RepID=Q7SZT2_XENLA|nr:transglutaminase 2 S homeolog [Xenopus laevis]AAH56053.1 Tgm2-prov protein [Xenopus laevis]
MAEELYLESFDLDCSGNNRSHRTAEASCEQLIVRRGQPFQITLNFSPRGYEEGVDKLSLNAITGPCPSEESGTRSHIPVSDALQDGTWSAAVKSTDGGTVILSITSPPDARIGDYNFTLETSTESQGSSFQLGSFKLLFNPWCPEDSVYLENEEERKEYVLCQHGIIFQGTKDSVEHVPWNFGQFEDGMLEIALQILDTSPKFLNDSNRDCSRRNDPVYISRVISAMVNCNDDKGVLYGRWDNKYDDGVSPMFWMGSVAILRRWRKFSCQAVKYGQCWVFGAVACTVLRCLGIPARVITNYNSAHDTNSNLLIEQYLDEQGKRQAKQKDIIWNYHCWVEAWMGRPDLGEAYNGWQVVDPTPQEKSEGTYCCGPAPVKAVKEGDLNLKYDVPFVFAEVNADVAYYVQQNDGSVKKTQFISLVGQKISTKAIGKDEREDITHNYKYPEGSEDERRVFEKANKQFGEGEVNEKSLDVSIEIKVSEGMNKGFDFDVFAVITNNTEAEKQCRLMFCARTSSYNGEVGPECGMKDLLNVTLPPQEEKRVPLRILYEKYGPTITDNNMIKLVAMLFDYSSKDIILAMRDIHIKNPSIKIKILGEPKQKRKLVAEISLKNPLAEPLTDCCFTVEGAGLTAEQLVQTLDCPVEPGQDAKVRVDLMPQLPGKLSLVVNFESDLLKAVKGYRNIIIAPLPK